ncbi:MAG: 30S ribosomal protein S14 [Rickettsiales bacterium]|jgi:small subunit ribosomal protein S14|nr:30S ribosomal protein S14 [Rickettsiales bacterium]
MAKTALIEKQKRRVKMVAGLAKKRAALKAKMSLKSTPEERIEAMKKMAKLPRNSAAVRLHNRCAITGRSRAYSRQFGLCRQQVRTLASEGKLPGVRKSSW